jgi:hypothetical protein
MQDPFVGTWILSPARSNFDPNHQPADAVMIFEMDAEGRYTLRAQGTKESGETVVERPQELIPDGRTHPIPDLPGLVAIVKQPEPTVIEAEVRREDGSLAGQGRYAVSADGQSLTATTEGFDSQLRRFRTTTVWERRNAQSVAPTPCKESPALR